MRYPLEVVSVGKQKIIGKTHIKYVNNMDLKIETNDLYRNISKNYAI